MQFTSGAVDALDYIAKVYSVGLVTNGSPAAQRAKIDAVSLGEWIDAVVFAGYDTPAKPSPESFRRALAALGPSPDRALVVGD